MFGFKFFRLLFAVLSLCGTPLLSAKNLIVIRHADRLQGSDDLNSNGFERAKRFNDMFSGEKVGLILSTHYNRARNTVEPLAQSQGLAVSYYETTEELVGKITESEAKTIVVVGHSNTVPEIVHYFSGIQVPDIEELEYDRLYIVFLNSDSSSNTLLKLKYFSPKLNAIIPF